MKEIINTIEYDTNTAETLAVDGRIVLYRTPNEHYFFAYRNEHGECYHIDPIPIETAKHWLDLRGFKMPRKKNQKVNRDERIMLLLTPQEKETIAQFAKQRNLVLSRYIVRIMLEHITQEQG